MRLVIHHKKKVFILFGFGMAICNALIMLWTFFTAFFNSGYQTRVYINMFNEAHFEAVFLPICVLWSITGFLLYLKELKPNAA